MQPCDYNFGIHSWIWEPTGSTITVDDLEIEVEDLMCENCYIWHPYDADNAEQDFGVNLE